MKKKSLKTPIKKEIENPPQKREQKTTLKIEKAEEHKVQ